MRETLIKGAQVVVTMDDDRRELVGADILIRDGVIDAVGEGLSTQGDMAKVTAACRPIALWSLRPLFWTIASA